MKSICGTWVLSNLSIAIVVAVTGIVAEKSFANPLGDVKSAEIQWAPTEMGPIGLDNTVEPKYCGSSLKRFLGCLGAIEKFAQLKPGKTQFVELDIENDTFVIKRNPELERMSFREYQAHRREKFKNFEVMYNSAALESAVELYKKLRQEDPNPKPFQIAEALNESMAIMFDPHRMYQPMFKYDGLNHVSQKPYIGVETQPRNGKIYVRRVVVNAEAERAGIKPGDFLVAFDGKPVPVESNDDIDEIMTFNDKQNVNVTVERKNRKFNVKVTFGYGGMSKVVDRIVDFKGVKYGYLHMSEVPSDLGPEPTCRIISERILKVLESKTEGLVLDLRNNPGGPGETAACISGLFVGKDKPIYIDVDTGDQNVTVVKGMHEQAYTKKLVLIVNAKTASSGELITSAIQFYARGLVIGDRTYGKSIGQITEEFLGQKFEEHFTIAKAYRPNGISYQSKGLTPDLYIFREGMNPHSDEIEMLREEDLALYPLEIPDRKPLVQASPKLKFPHDCARISDAVDLAEAVPDGSWLKDVQLQMALKTLECMK